MRVDKDGIVHFDMGGDIDAGATDASLGAAGEVNAADAIAGATDASLGAAIGSLTFYDLTQ